MNEFTSLMETGLAPEAVTNLKSDAALFLSTCKSGAKGFRLTPRAEESPFALCFAVFLSQLIGRLEDNSERHVEWAELLVRDLRRYAEFRARVGSLQTDKPFLQLLAFTLSALHLLRELEKYPLDDIVDALLPENMTEYLEQVSAFSCAPQSGNLAMCMAVLSIYARDCLGRDIGHLIDDWVSLHLTRMNSLGFWGAEKIGHIQFQNGYHQFEILEYLGVYHPKIEAALSLVISLADCRGQFAPYFGGSGCYDYDAVSVITFGGRECAQREKALLLQTGRTILSEQNLDGGFSESQWIRPRSPKRLVMGVKHVFSARGSLKMERARYFAAIFSPKHDRLHTHWSSYSRKWDESNLWDTWFRLLTIARIDAALNDANASRWGFIDFPGIGFHRCSCKSI